jgi:2-phospho-L-lactate transferase/gluconeogenesis factor (CofD/UPF0052 family)
MAIFLDYFIAGIFMIRKQKVYWSESERLAIVMRAMEVRQQRATDSLLDLFRISQKVLPASRQRRVRAVGEIPWFEELLNQKIAEQSAREEKSDPAIHVIREESAAQRKFLGEILDEIREQSELLRRLADHCK